MWRQVIVRARLLDAEGKEQGSQVVTERVDLNPHGAKLTQEVKLPLPPAASGLFHAWVEITDACRPGACRERIGTRDGIPLPHPHWYFARTKTTTEPKWVSFAPWWMPYLDGRSLFLSTQLFDLRVHPIRRRSCLLDCHAVIEVAVITVKLSLSEKR